MDRQEEFIVIQVNQVKTLPLKNNLQFEQTLNLMNTFPDKAKDENCFKREDLVCPDKNY